MKKNGLAGKKIQVILENLGTVNKQAEFVPDVKGSWKLDWELAGTKKRGRIAGRSGDRRYRYGSKVHRGYAIVADDPL